MNDRYPQLALREWGRHMARPATMIALAAAGVVLALAGPFGTDTRFGLLARLTYWMGTVVVTYGLGALCDTLLAPLFARRSFALRMAVTAVVSGVSIAGAVVVINAVAFGWWPGRRDAAGVLAPTFVIAAIVTVAVGVIRRTAAPAVAGGAPKDVPRILKRLPLDKRAPLVALSVEDHYVRVRTLKGEELVLMRLSDAIEEVGDTPGARVHRSHWAAFDQVRKVTRTGDRAILAMAGDVDIPVSRANLPRIKEAGLLP
ncbi:MAG: LytTR family DNA-binding domain-containing protein [Pseudomonadota bacterium]